MNTLEKEVQTDDCSNATTQNDAPSQARYNLTTGPIDFVHSPYETPSIPVTAVNNSQPTDKNEENCQ